MNVKQSLIVNSYSYVAVRIRNYTHSQYQGYLLPLFKPIRLLLFGQEFAAQFSQRGSAFFGRNLPKHHRINHLRRVNVGDKIGMTGRVGRANGATIGFNPLQSNQIWPLETCLEEASKLRSLLVKWARHVRPTRPYWPRYYW